MTIVIKNGALSTFEICVDVCDERSDLNKWKSEMIDIENRDISDVSG